VRGNVRLRTIERSHILTNTRPLIVSGDVLAKPHAQATTFAVGVGGHVRSEAEAV
jgi:hypothetical protein